MRTAEEFRQQAAAHNITRWPLHPCGFCGVWVRYVFRQGSVYFDGACDCVRYPSPLQPRDWGDVAEQYNLQTNSAVIAEMDAFWRFTPASEAAP